MHVKRRNRNGEEVIGPIDVQFDDAVSIRHVAGGVVLPQPLVPLYRQEFASARSNDLHDANTHDDDEALCYVGMTPEVKRIRTRMRRTRICLSSRLSRKEIMRMWIMINFRYC